jgi:hypothetical protein
MDSLNRFDEIWLFPTEHHGLLFVLQLETVV